MRFEHAPMGTTKISQADTSCTSAPGYSGFPVRLTLELFERAHQLSGMPRIGVWDPMGGAGSIPTVLGLLRPDAISRILATDISEAAQPCPERISNRSPAKCYDRVDRERRAAQPRARFYRPPSIRRCRCCTPGPPYG